ncbi:pentapeptide repeat-containing protein [Streptomyces sp. NBC_01262]|uniref:pentapeptide repeat-containing protein n=1 Tax=Streptomyces sp. NBC_01262 TaxID=2903803 RepID=UPI002E33B38C|nr:pentapeptide repeat-containing protein [Streptomyces sp. NBC_01262]
MELREKLNTATDELRAVYPFSGYRLGRDDIEWLIAEFPEEGNGSGLDLRGVDLSGEDLSGLPLRNAVAGLSGAAWRVVDQGAQNADHRETLYRRAAITLRDSSLVNSDLSGASLTHADLRGVNMSDCHLEGADLFRVNLGGDRPASLHGAICNHDTRFNEAVLASPEGVGPRLFDVRWNGSSLTGINWSDLKKVAEETRSFHESRRRIGDSWKDHNKRRITWYLEAAQTYGQLSSVLRTQGLNDQARRFTYRAEVARFWSLLHSSLSSTKKWPQFLFSLLLGVISGWGYRLYRSAILYAVAVFVFAVLYRETSSDAGNPEYSWREAITLSVIAFHGRAFYPNDPYALNTGFATVGAVEAFIGLFIEAIVIATLTRRIFSD